MNATILKQMRFLMKWQGRGCNSDGKGCGRRTGSSDEDQTQFWWLI